MSDKKDERLVTSLDKLLDDFKETHSKRMNEILYTLEDEDFAVAYFKLLEYTKPKLQRTEVMNDVDTSLNVKLTVITETPDEES